VATRRLAILGGKAAFPELIPITRPTLPSYKELAPAFRKVIESGMITKAAYLAQLEREVTRTVGARCVGVSSCTVGLVLALQALGVDGEVILPSFTFLATASAPALLRLPLSFVDIDRKKWTIDPNAVEAAITSRTAAVVAVHTFGAPADMDRLEAICRKRKLALIVDAAHGLGALRGGRPVGAGGDAEVFSMSPTKLVAAGEGGLITTTRADVAQRLEVLREYGNAGDYVTVQPGLNGRLDELSAVLALEGYRRLEANAKRRNRLVQVAMAELAGVPGITWQAIGVGDRSSYKDLSIAIEPSEFGMDRDRLASVLLADGVDTRKYYSPLVHRHPAFAGSAAGPLVASEWLETRSLSLPLFSHMPARTMRTVAQLVAAAHRDAAAISGAPPRGRARVA
jgi:dTDP-4-amino-4,6-dideoxygalactose transaminase